MTTEYGFSIDIPVVGEWDNVYATRLSLQTCVSTLFTSVDHRDVLAMVTGELLENAVKYARRGDSVTILRVRVWGTLGGEAHVWVSNPADRDQATVVEDTIARVQDNSPAEVFRQRVLEISRSPGRLSRLGLLRIAYEGGCRIGASFRDDVLTVMATVPCEL